MSVNRFDDLCDKLDSAVFNGDWLFDAENRAIFEEYLRRWDTELKSHGSASENNSDYAALLARHTALREAVAWERECIDTWEYGTALKMQALDEQVAAMSAARAEVDRLLNDGGKEDVKA